MDYAFPFFYDVRTHTVLHTALYAVSAAPGAISVLLDAALIMASRKRAPLGDKTLLMVLPFLPFVSFIVAWLVPGLSLQQPLIFACLLLNHFRFDARKDRELENRDRETQMLRLPSTLERVKPHFIYNVLSSIYYLCEKDPPAAQKAIGDFSVFLREALDHAEQNDAIPFSKELDLIRYYEQLEHVRFGSRFHIVYEIGPTDFSLPPFCVQPLVENAVKHGVKNGAEVEIRIGTAERNGEYLVWVIDTGAGFDPAAADMTGKPSGICNIRELMELTGCGTLAISSAVGKGTAAMLYIRKTEKKAM